MTRDSRGTSHPLSPSSTPSARNVASKDVQLANSTTSDTERKKKKKSYSGDVAQEQLKDRSDERKKEKKEKTKKKLKHSDEGKEGGAALALDGQIAHLNPIKVQTPEEVASEKSQLKKKRKAVEQSEETPDSKPFKKKKGHRPPDLPSTDPSVDESLSDQSRKGMSQNLHVRLLSIE
jgi:phage-related minor tail protein